MGGLERPVSKFATDLDEDLLGYIAVDPACATAREAGAELYERHCPPLFKLLKRCWVGRMADDDTIADLVHDTFTAAYASAGNYVGKGRAACLSWLAGIAKNLFKQGLERPVSVKLELVAPEESPEPEVEVTVPDDVTESRAIAITAEALDTLEERERDILLVTMEFNQPGKANQRLPNAVSAGLAARWGTTNDNIRMVRKRAMAKVKAYLEMNLKPQVTR